MTPILFRFFAGRLRHGYTEVFLSSDYLRDFFGKRAYWSRINRLLEALRIPVLVISFAFYLRFRLGFRTVSLDKSVRHFQFLLFSSNSSYNVELSGPAHRLMSPLLYLILDNAGSPQVSPGTLQFFVIRSFYCARLDASGLWLCLYIRLSAIFYWILASPISWRYLSKRRPTTNPEPSSATRDVIFYKSLFKTLSRQDSKNA